MQQKPAQKLLAFELHHLVPVSIAVVRVPEGDVFVIDAGNPSLADGDAVAIAGQVVDHPLGVINAGLG